jgi:AraC-like DNA-binding protein
MSSNDAVRWYLWDGGFLALGRNPPGVVPAHAHHAIQIVVAFDGESAVSAPEEEWRRGRGMIVMADVAHRYDGGEALGAMIFVDPESSEGAWLRQSIRDDITLVPDVRVDPIAVELRRFFESPLDAMDVRALIRHCVSTLCAGAPPARRLDPRVTKVLSAIRESDDLRMSLESAAAMVNLSPGRFAHLFAEQVGLPFRRYILWRKLARALLAIGREPTIGAAAQAGDFADAAHLTRTFLQMFGIPPSLMMRGHFFEVASPFDLAGNADGRPALS